MSAYRDALADLLEWAESVSAGWVPGPAAVSRARALLAEAQPVSPPQPVAVPTQQELEDLAYTFGRCEYDNWRLLDEEDAAAYARAVLARWGRPAPEPVSVDERPWEREGWCDAEGECWWGRPSEELCDSDWFLATRAEVEDFCDGCPPVVCLPYWALPVPQEQADG